MEVGIWRKSGPDRGTVQCLRWQRASSRAREVGNGVKEAVAASLCGAFEMGPRRTLASGF